MQRVFAYLRVSDASQVKGDGFTRQERAIRDYARAHNLQVIEVFREDMTGTEEHRPVLARLIVSLEQNHHGVTTVVIEKLDRLARDLMVQEAIIRDFKKQNFSLISTMEGSDLCGDDPTRKFIRQVMGAVAEYDKTMLVAKLRAARERKRAKGLKADGRLGYADSTEGQALVRHIRMLRRKPKLGHRRTLREIADTLNEEGYRTMDGHSWTLARVDQTLNPYKRKKTKKL
jgi:DNA invertase Pin-like site-specific DNA recombinase